MLNPIEVHRLAWGPIQRSGLCSLSLELSALDNKHGLIVDAILFAHLL
jgi:hypothetical protein